MPPRPASNGRHWGRLVGVEVRSYESELADVFVREGLNEGLQFNNPNVTGECGCGESFTV